MGVIKFLWKLPIKILKYGLPLLIVEPTAATGTTPRRRPLHTCGASCIATIHQACTKVQDIDGPLGTISRRTITVLNPFFPLVYGMLHHWLAVLSFIDDSIILNAESVVETIFPPSKQLFDKIDSLVCSTEALPEHMDDLFRNFPTIIHKFPLLDWALAQLISWLNFLLSALKYWGTKNNASEKEITIDVNCNDSQSCRLAFKGQTTDCPIKLLSIDRSAYEGKSNPEPSIHVHVEEHLHQLDPLHKEEKIKGDHIEPSYETEEVVLKSVKKLVSVKKGLNALVEEPHYATDSPGHYYESANTSPFSDSSQDENKTFGQMTKLDASSGCTYKEVLKKGTKEDEAGGGKDNDIVLQEVHEVSAS